jgi:hypothetical protein
MPKPIVNNKINYQNIYGLVSKFEGFVGQGVKGGDSPTFANLVLTGNATVEGNLYVEGNTVILDTNITEFEDNILLLNRKETGAGVTLNQSGLEVDRGTLENYRMVYNDIDESLKIGLISNLQSVATREDLPLQNGVMIWNNNLKRLDSSNAISIDMKLISTTNASSASNGSFVLSGGLGVQKDVVIDGGIYLRGNTNNNRNSIHTNNSTNSLYFTSIQDIYLTTSNKIVIPYNKILVFGDTTQNIFADNSTKNLYINSAGHIDFNLGVNKRINIPNQTSLTFATQYEQISTDSSNNMTISGSQDIIITPGDFKKIIIADNKSLAFTNYNQEIFADLYNNLNIKAGNDINLTPGALLNVVIPTDNGIKLGGSGNQRISSNSNNDLKIESSGDIFLTSSKNIIIPDNKLLYFGASAQSISSSDGSLIVSVTNNLEINNRGSVVVSSTIDSNNALSGSIYTLGGIGVSKTIYSEKSIIVNSDETSSFIVRKIDGRKIINVDSNNSGKVTIKSGDGELNSSVEISSASNSNSKSLISLKTQSDDTDGYIIGRGSNSVNSGRAFTLNLPTYNDYNNSGDKPKLVITSNYCSNELFSIETDTGNSLVKGSVIIMNVDPAQNATNASLVLSGGLGVGKNIVANGSLQLNVNSTQGILVNDDSDNQIFKLDTLYNEATLNGTLIVNNTSGVSFQLNNSFIVDNNTNVITNTMVNQIINTTDSTDTSSAALVVSGGASVQKRLKVADRVDFYNALSMHNTLISNVKDPISLQDVATKAYVDLATLRGLYIKQSVKIATVAPRDFETGFNPGGIIDGYTLIEDDRILIKDQVNPVENGVYIVRITGQPLRSPDMIIGDHAAGVFTFIKFGDLQASTGWVCNSEQDNDVVGTDGLLFVQFSGLGKVTAGVGLSKDFNEIYVNVDNSSIEIVSDSLRVKNTFAGTGLTGGSGSALQTLTDQSHVVKLGVINTGSWQASTVSVEYGGTGRTTFTNGCLLFGNETSGINTDSKLYFDKDTKYLGIGTQSPLADIHVANNNQSRLFIESDSGGVSGSSRPEIALGYNGNVKSYIGMTRTSGDFADETYSDAFVISHDKLDEKSVIHLATQQRSRLTILANGNVGINTSTPGSKLDINGTFNVNKTATFSSTVNSTSTSSGSVIVDGGVGIQKELFVGGITQFIDETPSTSALDAAVIIKGGLSVRGQNAAGLGNGGGLTVIGGASIGGDLYVGGSINGSGSSSTTFAYLTITATDEAINLSSGSILTFGGVTIQSDTNSLGITNGGSFLTPGGASIGKDVYIGGDASIYGETNYYNTMINMYDDSNAKRYTIDRDNTSNDFSITRYNSSGILLEKSIGIDGLDGSITFNNSKGSINSTSSSMVIMGGLSVNGNVNSSSITNGGSFTVNGGASIVKDLHIGGDIVNNSITQSISYESGAIVVKGGLGVGKNVNINGSVHVNESFVVENKFEYSGNGLVETIVNTDLSNRLWNYFGVINESSSVAYCEIDFYNGDMSPNIYGLKLAISINGTNCNAAHNYYGGMSTSITKIESFVYREGIDRFHLFVNVPPTSHTSVNVKTKLGNRFYIINEGSGVAPNGATSGYIGSWVKYYYTNQESTLNYAFGDVTVDGSNFKVADPFPVIGMNNKTTNDSRNLGLAFSRYQSSNNSGAGELVTDQYVFNDILPNQSSANSTQIKFSNLTNVSDNYYNGWWIRVSSGTNVDQVRKIVSYNGSQQVAQIDTPWFGQNPTIGDTIQFYNSQYVSFYYNDTKKSFELVYNTRDDSTKAITSYDYVNLKIKGLSLSDTTSSSNASSGSIYTLGGIGISNSTNSSSCLVGGTFTTLGGVGIRKKLYVGDNVVIGQTEFNPYASLHINQTTANIRLENATDSFSSVDFVKTGTGKRFGIVSDSVNDQFSLYVSNSGETPTSSKKAFTTTMSGYIGINTTTNINSPLTIQEAHFISSNTNNGYIGIIGGASDTNDSTNGARVVVYGNDSNNPGDIIIATGGAQGEIDFNTNNDNLAVKIKSFGNVSFYSTTTSESASSGSIVTYGGVGILCTKDAISITNGGALTVGGGVGITKDLYIGGDVFINGALNASGCISEPVITFSNLENCSFTGYDSSKLISISNEAIFSFSLWVTPYDGSQQCYIEFTIPERTTLFSRRTELLVTCNGYTDDDNVVPLFNVFSTGIKNETRGVITFQSVSSGIHYFSLICRYTKD